MKRFLILGVVSILTFALCACGNSNAQEATNSTGVEQEKVDQTPQDSESVEVDKGLLDVTLTIPADFMEEGKTQADYDAMAKEEGYKSITLNADGSVTYIMKKSQHKELMKEMHEEFEESLNELVGSEEYPNFVEIKYNNDFTEFEIITKSTELDFMESFSTLGFYMISGSYNAFNGTVVDNCKVTFINEATGEVIEEANSADMEENAAATN